MLLSLFVLASNCVVDVVVVVAAVAASVASDFDESEVALDIEDDDIVDEEADIVDAESPVRLPLLLIVSIILIVSIVEILPELMVGAILEMFERWMSVSSQ